MKNIVYFSCNNNYKVNIGEGKIIQVRDLTQEQIKKICRRIGVAFYEHNYGESEKGFCKFINN